MGNEEQISLRVPADFLERADALVPHLARVPELSAMGDVTRSKVLRLAIAKGLAALEAEHDAEPAMRKRRR